MATNNTPQKTLSRLIHSDYFELLSEYSMKYFTPKIEEHQKKCQHPKCIEARFKKIKIKISYCYICKKELRSGFERFVGVCEDDYGKVERRLNQ